MDILDVLAIVSLYNAGLLALIVAALHLLDLRARKRRERM